MTNSFPPSAPEPVTIPRSDRWRLRRESTGLEYMVSVAWPDGPVPPDGFPAIYVLDADASFATVTEAVRARAQRPSATGVGPALVVGVGYGGDQPHDAARRRADFAVDGEGASSGFREFLEHAVKPAVERRFPVDRTRQSLIGHSLGARFVVETLFAAPTSYETFVAISPSIWANREALMAAAERPLHTGAHQVRVLITVGELEQTLADWQAATSEGAAMRERRAERRMVDDAREVARRIAAANGEHVVVDFLELAGEDHASAVAASLTPALRLAARVR